MGHLQDPLTETPEGSSQPDGCPTLYMRSITQTDRVVASLPCLAGNAN